MDNHELARNRLHNVNKNFQKCPEFYELNTSVIHNYFEKGMTKVVNFEPN